MDRTKANSVFYFSKERLLQYLKDSEGNNAIVVVYKENIAISAELLLLSKTTVFSYLGGTKADFFNLRPNDLLKHTIIEWACANKYDYFVLGGGHKMNDGIFQYKKSFFKNDIVSFHTGRKIINKKIYKELCLKTHKLRVISEGFFPQYRDELTF